MDINTRGGKAYTRTPYHPEFVRKIKQVRTAKWNPKKRAWVVDVEYIPAVRQIMCEVFGESDIPAEGKRYDIKLTFYRDISGGVSDGVYFFGKCLAFAYNYGDGARFGDGVRYLSGGCALGGTPLEWVSIVKAGSVVMVYDIPEALIRITFPIDGVYYEFFERLPD